MRRRIRLPELEAAAQDLARNIGKALPRGCGFVLAVYEYGEGGLLTYVSSGERAATINMLKELVVTLQLRQDQEPGRPDAPSVQG